MEHCESVFAAFYREHFRIVVLFVYTCFRNALAQLETGPMLQRRHDGGLTVCVQVFK